MATTTQYVEGQDLHMQQVKAFLDQRAAEDAMFAIKYQTSGKTMKGCMTHLYKEGMKFIVMKKVSFGGRTCDVADVPNEIAHLQAIEYFMNDALNEEQPEPKTAPAPAPVAKMPASPLDALDAIADKPAKPKKKEKKPAEKKQPEKKAAAEDENIFDLLLSGKL